MPETIGVISDTHGLLRPEAIAALEGCDRIIHAGDVGSADVLNQLRRIAPVVAVRGNVDRGRWSIALPYSAVVESMVTPSTSFTSSPILDLQAIPAGTSAVVFGHSHQPSIEDRNGVLFLNPGSAGPRRFKFPVTVARMSVVDGRLTAQLIPLHPVTP